MKSLTPAEKEIQDALQANITTLSEALCDLVAAVVLCLVAVLSLVHAVVRLLFGGVGLLLWALALVIVGLNWLRSWAVSRSGSSIHRR